MFGALKGGWQPRHRVSLHLELPSGALALWVDRANICAALTIGDALWALRSWTLPRGMETRSSVPSSSVPAKTPLHPPQTTHYLEACPPWEAVAPTPDCHWAFPEAPA